MTAGLRSWQQKIKQHPVVGILVFVGSALGIALIVVVVLGYWLNWDWTGLGTYIPPTKDNNFQRGKTLWDWLQLLIIPLVLAVGALLFNFANSSTEQKIANQRILEDRQIAAQRYKNDQQIALDKQREDHLQVYLD